MDSTGRKWKPVLPALCAVLIVCLTSGCGTVNTLDPDLGASYRPVNVYRSNARLTPEVKRVAVLPLTPSDSTGALEAGVGVLDPILQSELGKSQRFELVPVSTEQLREWTGRASWHADEMLPANLFERVRAVTGCDAVLFSQLTVYQAYPPLSVGWKFSLVNCGAGGKGEILWSVDEVLDSGEPAVARGARAYYARHIRNDMFLSDPSLVLSSPREFGQYSLDGLLATLPTR